MYRDYWTYCFPRASAKKGNLVQWVSLVLRKVLIPENIFKGFQSTGIWLLNSEAMADKMGPMRCMKFLALTMVLLTFAFALKKLEKTLTGLWTLLPSTFMYKTAQV